ncbi:MAG TPA: hypothetical protein DCS43_10680 [Verrucomicrobia bacterium]|nr:hypothetical protein [Verrucomicrobiota bacterium]
MKCAIHQPQFIPWLGYLHKIQAADVFVFLDDVQFKKNEYQNRNRMRVGGMSQWITAPVQFRFGDCLNAVQLSDEPKWRGKLLRTLEVNYAKTPFFAAYMPGFADLIQRPWPNLAELNIACVEWLMNVFEMDRNAVRRSSRMDGLRDDPTLRLIDICRQVGADTYLSGAGGRHYLDIDRFATEGLTLEFQTFEHPVYPQHPHKGEFVPYLAALDGLFNVGGGMQGRRLLGLC